jgi:hypothetical protein
VFRLDHQTVMLKHHWHAATNRTVHPLLRPGFVHSHFTLAPL